ncbi:hypothetical protein EDD17DRAFT_1585057 [Pisolithus thermaeus]|nr:hypothetical protein EDD17DRAFT_1585057 [Pisolithus thermaeus]
MWKCLKLLGVSLMIIINAPYDTAVHRCITMCIFTGPLLGGQVTNFRAGGYDGLQHNSHPNDFWWSFTSHAIFKLLRCPRYHKVSLSNEPCM